jgi:hypothetical protein
MSYVSKYVGKCPNCGSEITVDFQVKKPKDSTSLTKEEIWKGAEPYVIDAIKHGFHTNKEIGDYVAKTFPAWRWKGKTSLIGFALTRMSREGKVKRTPVHYDNDKGIGRWISHFELPDLALETKQD